MLHWFERNQPSECKWSLPLVHYNMCSLSQPLLDLVHTSSPCARNSAMQLKIVFRAHLTKARLVKIFPNLDPSCRCKGQPADCKHRFWACPKLSTFWANIFNAYGKVL